MYQLIAENLAESDRYICDTSSIYFACILKNKAKGIIWGNRENSPDFLLVWSPYQEGFQLMGQPLEQKEWEGFRIWFEQTILPFLVQRKMECFEYGADTRELAEMFRRIFFDIEIFSEYQKMFRWIGTKNRPQRPETYEIVKVDREFLQNEKQYKNRNFIEDELVNAYGNLELFYQSGIAYAAVKDNEVVARADMLFCSRGFGNISVNTLEEHRRKGISSYLAMKTVEDTRRLGLIPVWDCTEDNLASEKTAVKCGFQMWRRDIISWFMIKER